MKKMARSSSHPAAGSIKGSFGRGHQTEEIQFSTSAILATPAPMLGGIRNARQELPSSTGTLSRSHCSSTFGSPDDHTSSSLLYLVYLHNLRLTTSDPAPLRDHLDVLVYDD